MIPGHRQEAAAAFGIESDVETRVAEASSGLQAGIEEALTE